MKRFPILIVFLVLVAAGIAAVLVLGPAGEDEPLELPETPAPTQAPAIDPGPDPDLPAPSPESSATHPEPDPIPAPPQAPLTPPAPEPWRAPIRNLSPEDRDRMGREAERAAQEHVDARRRKELEMFEKIMGPMDEQTGREFLDVYNGYHEEKSREMRRRVTEALEKARQSGMEPEQPDLREVENEVRRKTYEKLEKILNGDQLAKFRAWWEKNRPPREK